MSGRRVDPELRAAAMDAFCAGDPPPMTYADLDARLEAVLETTMDSLREKAGLNEPPPKRAKSKSPKRS